MKKLCLWALLLCACIPMPLFGQEEMQPQEDVPSRAGNGRLVGEVVQRPIPNDPITGKKQSTTQFAETFRARLAEKEGENKTQLSPGRPFNTGETILVAAFWILVGGVIALLIYLFLKKEPELHIRGGLIERSQYLGNLADPGLNPYSSSLLANGLAGQNHLLKEAKRQLKLRRKVEENVIRNQNLYRLKAREYEFSEEEHRTALANLINRQEQLRFAGEYGMSPEDLKEVLLVMLGGKWFEALVDVKKAEDLNNVQLGFLREEKEIDHENIVRYGEWEDDRRRKQKAEDEAHNRLFDEEDDDL